MTRFHFVSLLSTITLVTAIWTLGSVDRDAGKPDSTRSPASPRRLHHPGAESQSDATGVQVLHTHSESLSHENETRRVLGVGHFAPSSNRHVKTSDQTMTDMPEAFPLNESEWRDADAEEAGLEPYLEAPITMDGDRFEDLWGGDWKDLGGGW